MKNSRNVQSIVFEFQLRNNLSQRDDSMMFRDDVNFERIETASADSGFTDDKKRDDT